MDESPSLDQRLLLLRQMDHQTRWDSLDDQRICGICETVFTGRQIRFQRQGSSGYELHCPTQDCRPPHEGRIQLHVARSR